MMMIVMRMTWIFDDDDFDGDQDIDIDNDIDDKCDGDTLAVVAFTDRYDHTNTASDRTTSRPTKYRRRIDTATTTK